MIYTRCPRRLFTTYVTWDDKSSLAGSPLCVTRAHKLHSDGQILSHMAARYTFPPFSYYIYLYIYIHFRLVAVSSSPNLLLPVFLSFLRVGCVALVVLRKQDNGSSRVQCQEDNLLLMFDVREKSQAGPANRKSATSVRCWCRVLNSTEPLKILVEKFIRTYLACSFFNFDILNWWRINRKPDKNEYQTKETSTEANWIVGFISEQIYKFWMG